MLPFLWRKEKVIARYGCHHIRPSMKLVWTLRWSYYFCLVPPPQPPPLTHRRLRAEVDSSPLIKKKTTTTQPGYEPWLRGDKIRRRRRRRRRRSERRLPTGAHLAEPFYPRNPCFVFFYNMIYTPPPRLTTPYVPPLFVGLKSQPVCSVHFNNLILHLIYAAAVNSTWLVSAPPGKKSNKKNTEIQKYKP